MLDRAEERKVLGSRRHRQKNLAGEKAIRQWNQTKRPVFGSPSFSSGVFAAWPS